MSAQEKIICKIRNTPGNSAHVVEVIGEVDEERLESQDYKTVIVKNRQYVNNEYPSNKFLIDKKEIVEIIIFQEKKRLIVDKQEIMLEREI